MQASPASRKEMLCVDWRLRNFELAFLVFAGLFACVVGSTHLPFSRLLAMMFAKQVLIITGTVYGLSLIVVAFRAVPHAWKFGARSLRSKDVLLPMLMPYATLNFLVLTLRRAGVVLGAIYFFLHVKHLILWLHRVNYDLTFWNLDRFFHFGYQPNIIAMQAISPHQELAVLIDWLYIKYFTYKLLVSFFFLLETHGRKLTDSYVLAYVLLWSLGCVGYLAVPADGPCYSILAEHSVGPSVAELRHAFSYPITRDVPQTYIDQYKESKIWTAKAFQVQLWKDRQAFLQGKRFPGIFYGIAAMPSLHVAAVVMVAVFLFQASSVAGCLATLYACVIFVGSLFLQWHYAVDGYAGILLAALVCFIGLKTPQLLVKKERCP